ncbi:hypothetical protein Cgig2_000632 [Carnegiea gigantea]|uniref:Peptidase S26 domain-containing protein n=1 Tax=Carnegiea gigantea TaxID=171969 RepID=A0A9Q1KD11_9CARY|nr:hypothetical protein Cgig2_000632 [Carnegiea gigantea]
MWAARLGQWRSKAKEAAQRTVIIVKFLCLLHVTDAYIISPSIVHGTSMLPTLNARGDVLLAERISHRVGKLKLGDIIFVRSPINPNRIVTKRVLGLEGDVVSFNEGAWHSSVSTTLVAVGTRNVHYIKGGKDSQPLVPLLRQNRALFRKEELLAGKVKTLMTMPPFSHPQSPNKPNQAHHKLLFRRKSSQGPLQKRPQVSRLHPLLLAASLLVGNKAVDDYLRRQKTTKVPQGHVWIQGDNVYESNDSRHYGPVPYGLIQGKALCRSPEGIEFALGQPFLILFGATKVSFGGCRLVSTLNKPERDQIPMGETRGGNGMWWRSLIESSSLVGQSYS